MSANYNIPTVIKMYKEGASTVKLAKMFNCSISMIRDILIRYGVPLRTFSEAQKLVLDKDASKHPTRGKNHTEESKNKTSESMKKYHEKKKKSLKKNGKKKNNDSN